MEKQKEHAASPLEKQVVEKEKILKEKEVKLQEYMNDLKRVQADFENYVKRTERDRERSMRMSVHKLLLNLVDVRDDFERAMHAMKNARGSETMTNGMSMIFESFKKVLEHEGVRPIEAVGKQVDPHLHEVVKHLKSDKDDGLIVEEVQKGYFVHDQVLRPAKVIVTKVNDHG